MTTDLHPAWLPDAALAPIGSARVAVLTTGPLAATIRGIASHDAPMVGHFTDSDGVLDFLASAKAPKLAELGTSCPDHFLRTKIKPLILDLPADTEASAG